MKKWILSKWTQFTEWAAWSAWNYARKRAIRREKWVPGEALSARTDQSPDQVRISANEARHVLESRHFIDAWNSLNQALEMQALACDVNTADGVEKAARIITTKQLLHGLRREFSRKLDDGYMAEVELHEIAKKSRPVRIVR